MIPEEFLRVYHLNDVHMETQYRNNLQGLLDVQSQNQPLDLALLGELGEQARSLGHLEQSRKFLETALELAREHHDLMREVANLIRLGTTLQYLNQHDAGEFYLREALDKIESPGAYIYHDYALQHLGKLLAEKGQYQEARSFFEQALLIRQSKAQTGLIQSTEQALVALSEREKAVTS